MKIFKMIVIVFFILITLTCIGAFVFLKTFDAMRFKPQIIAALKSALGREVDFSDISLQVSLMQGVTFDLKQLTIQDDPLFQTGALFKVGEVKIAVNVLDYLTQRKISVSTIKIDSPYISVVRLSSGQMNLTSLGTAPQTQTPQSSQPQQPAPVSVSPPSTGTADAPNPITALPAIMVKSVLIENANVAFLDKTFDPPVSLAVLGVDVLLKSFSLSEPFPFHVEGSLFSVEKNIRIDGSLQLIPSTNQVKLMQVKFTSDLSKFSLPKLIESVPMLVQTPFPESLSGSLQLNVKELLAGGEGLSSLSMDLDLENGALAFKEVAPGVSLNVLKIGMSASGISFANAFPFKIQAALFSENPNFFIDGNAQVDLKTQSAQFKQIKISTDLASFDGAKIEASVASLKGLGLFEGLAGRLNMSLNRLEVGPKGLGALEANGEFSQGRLKPKQLALGVESMQSHFQATAADVILKDFSGKLGKGSFSGQGKVEDYMAKQNFSGDLKLEAINLAQVLEQKDLPSKVEGIVTGSFKVQGQGFAPEAIKKSLLGQGILNMTQGKLKDINILKTVLSGISSASVIPIPDLTGVVESSLPPQYKEKLTKQDTVLNKVSLNVDIKDGKIQIIPAEIEADTFLFSAQGSADFDQNYSLDGSFFIPKELSASIAADAAELRYLFDDQERIYIPLKIAGQGAKISVLPDLTYIAKRMLMNRGKSELEKVLNKVFDINNEAPQPQPQEGSPETSTPSGEKEKSPEQQILENILDKVFK